MASRGLKYLSFLAAIWAAMLLDPAVLANQPGVEGVLLLRNGNVLQGSVSRSGDLYRVASHGASLRVPANRVALFRRSITDVYQVLKRRLQPADARTHETLARWCLKNGLADKAAEEIEALQAVSAEHPALASLKRQVQIVQDARKQQTVAQANYQTPVVDRVQGADAPHAPSATHADSPETIRLRTDQPHFVPPSPTPVIKLSDRSRTKFVRNIQPMMVRSCGTVGCHDGGTDTSFQLNRLALTAGSHPKVFEQNLQAILDLLTGEAPQQSLIVKMAQQRHGPRDRPSTPLRQRQIDLLTAWVADVTGYATARQEALAAQATSPNLSAGAATEGISGKHSAGSVHPVQNQPPPSQSNNGEPTFEDLESLDWSVLDSRIQPPEEDEAFTPRDPFDPEIFNRLYGPDAESQQAIEAAPNQ